MKHLLLIIPILLLFLVNSCNVGMPISQDQMATALAQTQTAISWTVTPTQTYNPNILAMVNWLNGDLLSTANSLESTMDASYSVTDITFPHVPNSQDLIFRVDVGCICMNNGNCCIPERTFVVIVEAMKAEFRMTGKQFPVPVEVTQMMVVCSDPKTKARIGVISASWREVQEYVQNLATGFQLGAHATRIIAP